VTWGQIHDERGRPGYDLTRIPVLAWWIRRRSWQFQLIVPNQILFWVVIVVGFVGTVRFDENFGTTITWFVWFSLVFLMIMVTGRGWCAMCPFGGLAEWIQRGRLWRGRRGDGSPRLGLGRPVPVWLSQYGYITTAFMFGLLTWIEEYYQVADESSPMRTSWTVIGIIIVALASFLAFERRSFCRYLCPLGGLIGVLGAVAPVVGFRTRDRRVCRQCTTKDCLRGNENAYGCPWFNWPGGSDSNVSCGLCGECFRACPSGNVGLFVQPPLAGLVRARDHRADVAWTVAILSGIMAHQHLGTTKAYETAETWSNDLVGLAHGPNPFLFVLVSAACTMLLVAPAAAARRLLYRCPRGGLPDRGPSFVYRVTPFRMFFTPLAYAAIPLLGVDFLAVEMLAFTQHSPKVVAAVGRLFGAAPEDLAGMMSAQLMSPPAVVRLQVVVLVLATLTSVAVAWRITGDRVGRVARSPLAARWGAAGLLAVAGALVITTYIVTQGAAG
jgi:NosR/NirI family nitrous oxide reductase transcriptional regulator